MKPILSLLALLFFAFSSANVQGQTIAGGDLTVHTIEILDSTMYHADYSTNATVTRSSNPDIPKGSIAHLLMVRDPLTKIYSVRITALVINDNPVPVMSGPATLSTGFLNKTGNAAKMRGDGHTPSLSGGQVFLPAGTNINFSLVPAPPQ
jgi:hypothetical protein